MNGATRNAPYSIARLASAWLLVLVGLVLAIPAIAEIVELILPYFERTYYRPEPHRVAGQIAGVLAVRGISPMCVWAIAWLVRIGRQISQPFVAIVLLMVPFIVGGVANEALLSALFVALMLGMWRWATAPLSASDVQKLVVRDGMIEESSREAASQEAGASAPRV